MRVLKFGGSLLRDAAHIRHAVGIVAKEAQNRSSLCVVLSALEGVSDGLRAVARAASLRDEDWGAALLEIEKRHMGIALAWKEQGVGDVSMGQLTSGFAELTDILTGVYALGELSDKVQARILAWGPVWAVALFREACAMVDLDVMSLDARRLIVTDDSFAEGRVDAEKTASAIASQCPAPTGVYLVPGGIAASGRGLTTGLGRNGSDYTMSLLAAAFSADEAHLFTEGEGVATADLHRMQEAGIIERMSFEEAMELSHFGSGILHADTLQPLKDARIPLRVRCFVQPDLPGTKIGFEAPSSGIITGLSVIPDVALLRIQGSGMVGVMGVAARLFGVLAACEINVIFITQGSSEHSICVAVLPCDTDRAVAGIAREFSSEIARRMMEPPSVEAGLSVLAVVGENMRRRPGISGRLFSALGDSGVNVVAIAQGSSELNISLVIDNRDARTAVESIHRAFFN